MHLSCIIIHAHVYSYMYLMRDEEGRKGGRKEERKEQARSNKAKQHSTPKAVTFH